MLDTIWLSSAIGIFIGFTLALTGAGGAILSIPLLVLLLGLDFQQAAPIALLTVFSASSIGSIQGLMQGIVRYKAALLVATIGSFIAPLGVISTNYLAPNTLKIILAIVLFYIAIRAWRNASHQENDVLTPPPPCEVNPMTSKLFWNADCTKHLLGIGAITGFLSGLLGVGGGFLIVPALKKVTNLANASVIATTLSITALISVSAFISHLQHTQINWQVALPLVVCATLSMLVMGKMRHKIPTTLSQQGFAALCVLAAISMLS